jgi:hypothetical protein
MNGFSHSIERSLLTDFFTSRTSCMVQPVAIEHQHHGLHQHDRIIVARNSGPDQDDIGQDAENVACGVFDIRGKSGVLSGILPPYRPKNPAFPAPRRDLPAPVSPRAPCRRHRHLHPQGNASGPAITLFSSRR